MNRKSTNIYVSQTGTVGVQHSLFRYRIRFDFDNTDDAQNPIISVLVDKSLELKQSVKPARATDQRCPLGDGNKRLLHGELMRNITHSRVTRTNYV